jgi:transposase-like protein
MQKRRSFSGRFKAQVVLEVLTGVKSAAQVCREHGIKETVLSRWKQEFIARAPELIERRNGDNTQEARVAELERVVGRLTLELEMAKKASLLLNSPRNSGKPW